MKSFSQLFMSAAQHEPYLYQERLAMADAIPSVLNAPTGSGKTAAAFFAWYYRRRAHPDEAVRRETPRRLVYCLPMRVLVEQTFNTVASYLKALEPDPAIGAYIMMGGEVDDDWQLDPEKDAVIIGTQDMLLSRALNRGYAMSRFRWPVPFALLNNDTLWVIDELQLMGAGVPTTAQLSAFRENLGTFGSAKTMWMSATVNTEWLNTVDHRAPGEDKVFSLNQGEQEESRIKRCLDAGKILEQLHVQSGARAKGYPKEVASKVITLHHQGTQTIVIVNTVSRAQALSEALSREVDKQKDPGPEVLLLHSRFRPQERRIKADLLTSSPDSSGPGRIVVSTQVIEPVVDITSACLITELAPWASMVQRFGRCNRYGEEEEARVFWIDLPVKALPCCSNRLKRHRKRASPPTAKQ